MSATYNLRPGCSRIAHERLGFCGHCPEFTMAAEGTSWRILALTGTPADPVLLLGVMHDGERFVASRVRTGSCGDGEGYPEEDE